MTDCPAQDGACPYQYQGEDCEGCIAIAALKDEDSLDDSGEDEDDEEMEEEGQLEAAH